MTEQSPGFVLIVDDDESIRESLTDVLEDEGYRVRSASNGKDALELLRSGPAPRLILLDLMMPVMDGWEFREEQRRDPALAQIPVCFISAAGQRRVTLIEGGCFLPKPIQISALLEAVANPPPASG